ncbi:helix-turn-helix domain-containing protein [Treponema sp. OMZ 799]|uniref:helix-turn-helix transcriptional regulator n=1 Tax=Treponema sp. OMZ 799 TaxID=2563668 RepID=UPI0020A51D22|nr:helix-turn-helix domain-containing protein [Treponema sp. OMZ 799]UTC77587.1 helix-turn-helix domain-containing protein [Treponema sp. OMZ 799]
MIMNMQQVMELTGYTRSYIYNLVYKKMIPVHKPTGGRLFFVKEEIEQWLMGGRQLTSQELNATADKILLEMGARRTQRRSK